MAGRHEEYIGVTLAVLGGVLYVLSRARLGQAEMRRQARPKGPLEEEEEERGLCMRMVHATLFARLDTWYFIETQQGRDGERSKLLRRGLKAKTSSTEPYFEPLNRFLRSHGKQLSRATVVALSCLFCMACSIAMSLANKCVRAPARDRTPIL